MRITREQYLELISPPSHEVHVTDSGVVVIDDTEIGGDIRLGMVLVIRHAETDNSWPQLFNVSLDQARDLIAALIAGDSVASSD